MLLDGVEERAQQPDGLLLEWSGPERFLGTFPLLRRLRDQGRRDLRRLPTALRPVRTDSPCAARGQASSVCHAKPEVAQRIYVGTRAGKNPRRASAISARTGAPDSTTSTIGTDVWM